MGHGSIERGLGDRRHGTADLDAHLPATAGPFKASSWTAGCNVAPFSATNTICGTAADVGSGVSGVGVSIQSTSGTTSGMYWGGSSFDQATETGSALRAASSSDGFAHWTLSFPAANLPDGTFTVRVHAIDAAGNSQAATTAQNLTIDNTAPVTTDNAPGGLAALDGHRHALADRPDRQRVAFGRLEHLLHHRRDQPVRRGWGASGDDAAGRERGAVE